jgi:hypothetical protein
VRYDELVSRGERSEYAGGRARSARLVRRLERLTPAEQRVPAQGNNRARPIPSG